MDLSGKRILFIAPMFFGYERLIAAELEASGATVDYFSDRPGGDFLTKSLIRIDRRLLAAKTNRYYDRIIEATRDTRYDQILIVRGEAISLARLRRLREAQPSATLSLYLWDSMHYNPNARVIWQEFDKVFSFDRPDADANPRIAFLPLFYSREFDRAAAASGAPEYDACFIGTIHTDRYRVLEKVIATLEARGRKVFVYCYYPSKTLFRIRTLFDPGFRRFARRYLDFAGMKLPEVVDRIAMSRSVIDINRPSQRGLTMRTVEAIGAQRKLITTNQDIVNYDIYRPQGVLVVDRANPVIDDAFLDLAAVPFDEQVRRRYAIGAWLETIFG
jgi:hypothetical protein